MPIFQNLLDEASFLSLAMLNHLHLAPYAPVAKITPSAAQNPPLGFITFPLYPSNSESRWFMVAMARAWNEIWPARLLIRASPARFRCRCDIWLLLLRFYSTGLYSDLLWVTYCILFSGMWKSTQKYIERDQSHNRISLHPLSRQP